MKHILKLTAVVFLFGLASGLMIAGAPQAGLALRMSSQQLGVLGSGMPLGYIIGCLLFGRLFERRAGKYVLLWGILAAAASAALMGVADSLAACVAANAAFGLAGAAVWPFCSAWMLDFQHDTLSKTTILRYYNVAWTSGTAIGMLLAGILCKHGLIAPAFFLAAAVIGLSFVIAAAAPATRKSVVQDNPPPDRPRRVGVALLLAAVSANLLVLATRATIVTNYAELNQFLNFEADRMGVLLASALVGQLFGFLLGAVYEPVLGRRSMYAATAASLVAINLTVAYVVSMPVLICAMALCGLVAAVGFQTAFIAAVECFRFPRTGTTFHEAMVGVGGMGTCVSGLFVEYAKAADMSPLTALRTPYLALAAATAAALLLQLILVTARNKDRVLLPATQIQPQ